jgi:tRNA-guanine family transglycosylase
MFASYSVQVSGQYKTAFRPPVEGCTCHTCSTHSLAYLHHLMKAKEPLAATLLAIHNVHHMNKLMAGLRAKILDDEI